MPLIIITPLIGWAWPSLIPLALAAASVYGYRRLTGANEGAWMRGHLTTKMENLRRVTLPLDELMKDVVGEELGRDERLVFEKDEMRLVFRRDARSKFFVEVVGPRETPTSLLRKEAMAFAQELVQQFVYDRVTKEMEARGISVVGEEVKEENGSIEIQARRWR